MSSKLRVVILYGGQSGEHEISLQSAASVMQNLDHHRFEIIPIKIDKQGQWQPHDLQIIMNRGADVIFPVLHGPLCEDGTIQGLLELAGNPYVGCSVLASAVGMDKDMAKRLARDAGLPIVPYVIVKSGQSLKHITQELGFPVFVKPANLGSSVGVHKVKEASALEKAIQDAFRYDSKILVERAISGREIEVSVLENSVLGGPPLVSVPGEIIPTHEFYSYEAKYLDKNGARLLIPAPLSPRQVRMAQQIGRDIFVALECEGMARVDLFLDQNSEVFYFNEINTIPGFTKISMYPKLWEASGIAYPELLSRLIDLALTRHQRKQKLVRDYHQEVVSNETTKKGLFVPE